MTLTLALELLLATSALTCAGTGLVLIWLRRHQILDQPNDRSSHAVATPRGGGLAVVPVLLLLWLALTGLGLAPWWTIVAILGAAGLAFVSWRDDRGGLPVLYRLGAQFLAVLIVLAALPGTGHIFQGMLAPWLDVVATALLWVWFINLYNFMDGIDGITGAETLALGLGVALVAFLAADFETGAMPLGIVLAAVALGFLPWNWQPAKLFMGDVGSVPLGFLTGWLLLGLAGRGYWAPALILPLYYLADATLTLIRRGLRGRAVWRAHREHVYQRAVQLGLAHGSVVWRLMVLNVGLVLLAWLGLIWPIIALVLAGILVIGFIAVLLRSPTVATPLA